MGMYSTSVPVLDHAVAEPVRLRLPPIERDPAQCGAHARSARPRKSRSTAGRRCPSAGFRRNLRQDNGRRQQPRRSAVHARRAPYQRRDDGQRHQRQARLRQYASPAHPRCPRPASPDGVPVPRGSMHYRNHPRGRRPGAKNCQRGVPTVRWYRGSSRNIPGPVRPPASAATPTTARAGRQGAATNSGSRISVHIPNLHTERAIGRSLISSTERPAGTARSTPSPSPSRWSS